MAEKGAPKHKGTTHNKRIRGQDTWSSEDRRLKRHLHRRIWNKRGFGETWTAQVNRLDKDRKVPRETSKVVSGIVLGMATVAALSAGGRVLVAAVFLLLAVAGWRKLRR